MKIRNEPAYLTEVDIKKVEKKYKAKYVFESPLCINGCWNDDPSLIFYNETPHPEGSNYFAISRKSGGDYVISNGLSAVDGVEIRAVRAVDGDIIYSRCRHDYRTSDDGSVSVDGGRDYFRYQVPDDPTQIDTDLLTLHVINGKLVVKDENENKEKNKWRSIEEPFEQTDAMDFTG